MTPQRGRSRTLDHVGHSLAGQVQHALDVQVVGGLRAAGRTNPSAFEHCSADEQQ